VSDKYKFIGAQYAEAPASGANAPTITCMCKWLGVSKSGFYEWRSRPDSATVKRREKLKLLITKAFEDSDGTYGYRRIWWQLARWGVPAGPELVRTLMRELGLVACQPRPWRPATTVQGQAGPIPDLMNRDFTAAGPGVQCRAESREGAPYGLPDAEKSDGGHCPVYRAEVQSDSSPFGARVPDSARGTYRVPEPAARSMK
jgi:hypothetical protein